jgi:lambda family phage tail tape measure protein
MADIRYTGEFVDQISPKLKDLQQQVSRTNSSFSGMGRVLTGLTAAFSTKQLIDYTSTWTDLNSRFRNAVGDADGARAALDSISRTAQSTYSSLQLTADTFLRNNQTLKELGYTTNEQVNLSEALNNALAVSGTKGQQAESVMSALGKAFATGKLSGDNFNTVLSSGGRITQALADGLGVTTLELRQLASTGKLETGVVIEALISQMNKLRDEAGAMPATVRDAFVVLNNSVAQFIGKVDEAGGTSEALANIIVKLSKALDAVAENATTIQRIAIVLREVLVVAGVLLSVFVAFRAIKLIFTALVAVFKNIGGAITSVIATVKSLGNAFKSAYETVKNFFSLSAVNRELLKKQLESLPGPAKKLGGVFNESKEQLAKFIAGLPLLGAALAGIGVGVSRAKDAIDDWNNASSGAKEAQQEMADETAKAARAVKAEEERIKSLSQARVELSQKISDNISSYSENNQMMLEAMKIRNQQIGMDEEQIRLTNALLTNERNYFREYSSIQKEIVNLQREASKEETSNADREKAAQAIKLLQDQQRELGRVYQQTGVAVRDLVVQETELLKVQKQRTESQSVNKALDAAVKQNRLLVEGIALETAKLNLSESQKEVVDQLYSLEAARLQAIEPLLERINNIKLTGSKADQELIPILEAGVGRINKQYGEQITILNELLTKKEEELRINNLNQFTRSQQMDLERELQKIQDDTAKLTMTEIERKYYDIEKAAERSAKAAIEAEQARRGSPLSTAEQQEYYRVATENAEKLAEATRKHNEQSRSWSTGWEKAYKDYADNAGNAAKTAESVFKKSTQGMEDAIVNFAKTGKFEWKGFVNSILEELLRAQVRQLIAKTFGLGGLGGGGGGGGGGGSLFGGFFATGGMIPPGRFGVVGESGPELVQGPANVTPLTSSNITYNINAVDALSFKQMVASDPSFLFAVTEQGRRSLPQSRR